MRVHERSQYAARLLEAKSHIANEVMEEFLARHPDWLAKYGERARTFGRQDVSFHIDFLAGAIEAGSPEMFAAYTRWCARTLEARGVGGTYLTDALRAIGARAVAAAGDTSAFITRIVAAGCEACLDAASPEAHATASPLEPARVVFTQAATRGDSRAALAVAYETLRSGVSLLDLYAGVLQVSQEYVGICWEANTHTVAEEHLATAVTDYVMAQLFREATLPEPTRGTALVSGVAGERHQLGAAMVAHSLALDGWRVQFLGSDLPPDDIVTTARGSDADLVAISATMLFNLGQARQIAVRMAEAAPGVKILAGGAAFGGSAALARELGCHGYGRDLVDAQREARALAG